MSVFSGITDLIGKGMDKIWPDKSKCREQQAELNKLEIQGAPQSRARLWRCYLFIGVLIILGYVVIIQPIIMLYWPNAKIPIVAEETVKFLWQVLLIGLGGAF